MFLPQSFLMMVMMMVMVVICGLLFFYMAIPLMTMLTLTLQFQSGVVDSVFLQFLTDLLLDPVRIAVCNNVHSRVIGLPVHAPNMNMVYIQNAVNMG